MNFMELGNQVMRCPLSGKPCIMPKEIFVTEVRPDGIHHLFMCRLCGEEYIRKLTNADVVTKSLEVVSSAGGISHSEHILEEHGTRGQTLENSLAEHFVRPTITSQAYNLNQIKAVEAKMQAAIDREDYESAAKLRNILHDLQGREVKDENQENSG